MHCHYGTNKINTNKIYPTIITMISVKHDRSVYTFLKDEFYIKSASVKREACSFTAYCDADYLKGSQGK